jgi:steroid 5-alpha reductase family enzyme
LLVNLVVSAVVVAVLMLATFGYAMRTGRDTGLWRYTRHPNYFGDSVVWFGLWLLACSHWAGVLTVVAPAFMTNMLVRHTGKKLLEKHMARSKGTAYADYVRRTSGFIPWPPRLSPGGRASGG